MHGHSKIGMLCGLLMMTLSACQATKPCDCGLAEKELRRYASWYFDEVERSGNLRQDLKACQEKKP